MKHVFAKFAERVSNAVGTPWAFLGALAIILVWGSSGPVFRFSEQWQLAVNSFTTIVTFLMVFVIQNTQNRDFQALLLTLDALLLTSSGPAWPPPVLPHDRCQAADRSSILAAARHGQDAA